MLAVFPVTRESVGSLSPLALLFQKQGPNAIHGLVLVPCPTVADETRQFAHDVRKFFRDIEISPMGYPVQPGHAGRNAMFAHAARLAGQQSEPWIWMEECWPVARGWLDALQQEWQTVKNPFTGIAVDTWYARPHPTVPGELAYTTGLHDPAAPPARHMRIGVYPAEFGRGPDARDPETGRPWRHASKMIESLGNTQHFEVTLQDEIVPHMFQSSLMEAAWASKEWEQNAGRIYGKPHKEAPIRKFKSFKLEGLAILKAVDADGSLGFLLTRKQYQESIGGIQQQSTRLADSRSDALAALEQERNVLKAENEALRLRVASLEAELTPGDPAPPPGFLPRIEPGFGDSDPQEGDWPTMELAGEQPGEESQAATPAPEPSNRYVPLSQLKPTAKRKGKPGRPKGSRNARPQAQA